MGTHGKVKQEYGVGPPTVQAPLEGAAPAERRPTFSIGRRITSVRDSKGDPIRCGNPSITSDQVG